jgi:hypothetical protein
VRVKTGDCVGAAELTGDVSLRLFGSDVNGKEHVLCPQIMSPTGTECPHRGAPQRNRPRCGG